MHRHADLRHEEPDISRQALARLIRTYLAGEISAFRFDESLQAFHRSGDPHVREVTRMLWYFYDDIDDHHVRLSKRDWDLHQRLLLALESDCRIEEKVERIRSIRQPIAAIALMLFVWAVYMTGWGAHWVLITIPFGLVSLALRQCQPETVPETNPFATMVWPFASFADLSRAYVAANFRKCRYPEHVERRYEEYRIKADRCGMNVDAEIMGLIFSPFVLLYQTLPETSRTTEFRVN